VNSDGTFSGVLVGSYSAYSFNGVIDDGVSEIEYIYNDSGSARLVVCRQAIYDRESLRLLRLRREWTAQTGGGGKYLSGSAYFNGGTLTATNVNGALTRPTAIRPPPERYTVNSNNTISITMNLAGQTTAQTYVVASARLEMKRSYRDRRHGDRNIDIQSQLQLPGTPYSNASLNGIYQPPVEAVKSTSTM